MDNLCESQYPHPSWHSKPNPQFPIQEEQRMQMIQFNPIKSALEHDPEVASMNQPEIQSQVRQGE